jgi:hypothetical protein
MNMITIVPCTTEDCATVAELWNAKRLDAASCWYGADTVDADYIAGMLAWGFEVFLARDDANAIGFGLWCAAVGAARLVAIAAGDDETYYRLLAEFCDWGLAAGAQAGYAEIGTASTTERGRMDALGVIEVTPIGFEPLLNGQSPAERVPKLLRAECALGVLRNALDQILEPAP